MPLTKRPRSTEESGRWNSDPNVMPRHVAKRRRLDLLAGSETIYQLGVDDGPVRLLLSYLPNSSHVCFV
jgi:hypothetical protein